jgi:membrane protein DedA with SNARE-associated domain
VDAASIEAWLLGLPVLAVLLVLGAAAFVEYVFPPFPGDTVVVVGAVWAVRAEQGFAGVLLAVTLGALLGTVVDWYAGRRAATQLGRLSERRRGQVDRLVEGFQRYGPALLVANRFVPGVRALFFVAAGVANLRLSAVVAWATLSAALWNGVLLGLGAWVGWNLEALLGAVRQVGLGVAGLLVVLGLGAWAVWSWRR